MNIAHVIFILMITLISLITEQQELCGHEKVETTLNPITLILALALGGALLSMCVFVLYTKHAWQLPNGSGHGHVQDQLVKKQGYIQTSTREILAEADEVSSRDDHDDQDDYKTPN